jgi:hypothetical protein
MLIAMLGLHGASVSSSTAFAWRRAPASTLPACLSKRKLLVHLCELVSKVRDLADEFAIVVTQRLGVVEIRLGCVPLPERHEQVGGANDEPRVVLVERYRSR